MEYPTIHPVTPTHMLLSGRFFGRTHYNLKAGHDRLGLELSALPPEHRMRAYAGIGGSGYRLEDPEKLVTLNSILKILGIRANFKSRYSGDRM